MDLTIRQKAGAGALFALLLAFPTTGHTQAHAHMAFTSGVSATAADTARALEVVRKLRVATADLQTLEAAEAAGYAPRQRPDKVRAGAVLHVARTRTRGERPRAFDLSRPQVLLFQQDAGGTMEYCHGVGWKLAHLAAREHGASGLDVMRRIKAALDPAGILNPGKGGL